MNTSDTRRRRFPWGGWLVAALLWSAIVYIFYFSAGRPPHGDASCSNNMHQIGLAIGAYESDWDALPRLRTERQQAPEGHGWPDLIGQYVKTKGIFTCPGAPKGYLTYSYNRRLSGRQSGPRGMHIPIDTATVYESPSDRRAFNNLNGDTIWHYRDGGMPQPGQYVPWDGPVEQYTRRWPTWALPRHDDVNIVLFSDGHVKWMEPDDLPRFDPEAKEGQQ